MTFIAKDYSANIAADAISALNKKFEKYDADQTGYISYEELARAFAGQETFSLVAAKLLSRVYSQQCYVNQEQCLALYNFVVCVQNAFADNNTGGLMTPDDVKQALFYLNFNFTKHAVFMLCNNFGHGSVSAQQFMEIACFSLLGRKLFGEWDNQMKGEITIGLEQVLRIAMWFM